MLGAAPIIGGLLSNRAARAQGSGVKRAVFVYTPGGAPRGLWLPKGRTLNTATQAFEGLQQLCNFREVEVLESGHGLARKCLGQLRWDSDWTGDTIDQQIASVLSTSTPYQSYVLGVQTSTEDYVVRRSGAAVPAENSPAAAYQQLFGGAASGGDSAGFLARQRSVMDINRAALAELKERAGSLGRAFDEHAAALEELERRIVDTATMPRAEGCDSPSWNAAGHATSGDTSVPFQHTAELQSDIIVAALQCGLTHVMTLQLGWHQQLWYGHDTAYQGDHHSSAHAAQGGENAEMTNYLSRCVAYLVRRLLDTDDPAVPGSKMIDNTVVVQVSDMGDGRDHSGEAGPSMVATRLPGFKHGTVTQGGNNLMVLETVVEGLGLGAYVGKDPGTHKIWPCADGQLITDLLG
ncbi:MAG: DUF1552 domain-containing protein [Myxococcales bacterium]|nr:DUF1552 domain-containing protein [Myxococcales bacterium]